MYVGYLSFIFLSTVHPSSILQKQRFLHFVCVCVCVNLFGNVLRNGFLDRRHVQYYVCCVVVVILLRFGWSDDVVRRIAMLSFCDNSLSFCDCRITTRCRFATVALRHYLSQNDIVGFLLQSCVWWSNSRLASHASFLDAPGLHI